MEKNEIFLPTMLKIIPKIEKVKKMTSYDPRIVNSTLVKTLNRIYDQKQVRVRY